MNQPASCGAHPRRVRMLQRVEDNMQKVPGAGIDAEYENGGR